MRLLLLLFVLACGNPTAPIDDTRLRACLPSDTVWVTICGDSTFMTIENCY